MHAELTSDITEQVLKGIAIPPCPSSLTLIMREARNPSADFASIAQLIARDAGFVGPLLKLANSPFIGLRSKVTSVFQAVSVLGLQNTLNLVQNIGLRQSMGNGEQSFEKFWERSSLSATIAEKLATKFPGVSKDDAYIAALFHDCGIPVLMMKFPNYREAVMAQCKQGKSICAVENDIFSTCHTVVGNMLTRSWLLPAQVSQAILHHHEPGVFDEMKKEVGDDALNLIGIVHMAECIVDEHLNVRDKEWVLFEHAVLTHFEMTTREFTELKEDIINYLNGVD